MTRYGNTATTDALPASSPPSHGGPGATSTGDSTAWGPRTLLVSGVGGLAVGAATGTLPLPVIGTAVGVVIGGACGVAVGAMTVAVIALALHRRPELSSWAARALFSVPTIVAVGACALLSVVLLYSELRHPTGFPYDRLMILTFAVPAPLAPTLMAFSAPWCLQDRVPSLSRSGAGRHVWYAAIPILVVLVLATPVSLHLGS